MIKNSILALVAATTLVGATLPAFADSEIFGDGSEGTYEFTADSLVNRLQAQGVNATSVEEWGGFVRAYVVLEDGTETMQLFTPGLLEPVAL